jgi:hypothetical protein
MTSAATVRRLVFALALAMAASAALSARAGYEAEIRQWRADHEATLRADDGWLTVSGLFWLKPGLTRVGADPSNAIVLPAGSAPARLGVLDFRDGAVRFQAEPGTHVTSGGNPVENVVLRGGARPVSIQVNHLTMFVIVRGERTGIRLRDADSAARRSFTGERWYPIDPAWRVTARFVPYPEPKIVDVPNILGDTVKMAGPGYVEFTVKGRTLRLVPVVESPDARQLFFIIGDGTNGRETYHAGRFLYTDLPHDGTVVLDFNKLESPPCAFTAFATCPLPPPANRLPIDITAGELSYGGY